MRSGEWDGQSKKETATKKNRRVVVRAFGYEKHSTKQRVATGIVESAHLLCTARMKREREKMCFRNKLNLLESVRPFGRTKIELEPVVQEHGEYLPNDWSEKRQKNSESRQSMTS